MNRRAHGRMNPTNVRRSWGARQESGKPEHKGLGYLVTLAGSKGRVDCLRPVPHVAAATHLCGSNRGRNGEQQPQGTGRAATFGVRGQPASHLGDSRPGLEALAGALRVSLAHLALVATNAE